MGILILRCPATAITQLLTNTVQTASVRIENEGLMDYRQSDISRAQVDIITTTGDMDTSHIVQTQTLSYMIVSNSLPNFLYKVDISWSYQQKAGIIS